MNLLSYFTDLLMIPPPLRNWDKANKYAHQCLVVNDAQNNCSHLRTITSDIYLFLVTQVANWTK